MLDLLKSRLAKRTLAFLSYWASRDTVPGAHSTARIDQGVRVGPSVTLGRYSYINGPNTFVQSGSIGAFCSIAWGVTIGPDEHPVRAVSTHPFWYNAAAWFGTRKDTAFAPKAPPVIGNDVWIGCNAVILRGAVIEDGAIIGAGAIVAGRIPAYAIAVGIPARIIGYRFDDHVARVVRESEWWSWDEDRLVENLGLFATPSDFVAGHAEIT